MRHVSFPGLRRVAGSLIGVWLVAGAAAAAPLPQPIAVPAVGGNGHAETWDGRVFVQTANVQGRVGWVVRAFRPEALALQGARPDFARAFSAPLGLEFNGDPGGLSDHNALALVPDPSVATNPYPADAAGRAQPGGAYRAYDALLITQHYAPQDDRLGQRRLRIVVADPETPQARIQSAQLLDVFQEFRAGNQPLRGIEPTATFDGHLLIWQGHPDNDGKIDVLLYSLNQVPGSLTGWTRPRSLADLYHVDKDTLVAGIPARERFPLAAQPLVANDGSAFRRGDLYRGAYPWVTRDGTELFHTTSIAGQAGVNRARRGALSVIGRWTGWTLRHIDGPLNPDREATVRLFFSSPGATPSFWRPFPTLRDPVLPLTPRRPVFPLFGSNTANYGEVDFADLVDGDYALALGMNEVLRKDTRIDPSRTPDTSGHGHLGRVEGARFPQELGQGEVLIGAVGQGLSFDGDARVRVPAAPSLEGDALTCELFVKRERDLSADPRAYQFLAHQPGRFHLILEPDGTVQATVFTAGQQRRSGRVGPALPLGAWVHVAMTYAPDGALRVYLDGELQRTAAFPAAPLDRSTRDLLIGPSGQTPGTYPAGQPLVILDELRLSRVARSAAELRATAYRPAPPPSFPGGVGPLPLGLDPRDLKVPTPGAASAAEVALGELLFFDPRLSATGAVACSSCHDPARGFSDGFQTAVGLNGQTLRRNTPTVVNRAFSTLQFWDGRSPDLEQQARVPIEHPDEMGSTLDRAVAAVQRVPGYPPLFAQAYGGPVTGERLLRALAAYQRSLLSGDSRVDRFEAGQTGALTPSELRGRELFRTKARCTACHGGATFTDEAFHDTGFVDAPTDLGRFEVSGRELERRGFKTPTLRDVSRTAPYLHDGSVGRDPEVRPLGLSAQERADLVAYLRALDSTTVPTASPQLPPNADGTRPQPGSAAGRGGAPPPPPPPPAPAGPGARGLEARAFVGALYRDVLLRQAEPGGLAAHSARLDAGATRAEVARTIVDSTEHLRRRVTAEHRALLGADPAPAVRDQAVQRLQGGQAWEAFTESLVASPAYSQRHAADAAFVEALYRDLLGRGSDPGGLAAHLAGLRSGVSRARLARGFLASPERRTRVARAAYAAFLGRAPSDAERDEALRLQASGGEGELWRHLLGAEAYFLRNR